MKKLPILFLGIGFLLMSFAEWKTDFEAAKQQAKQSNKLILLNFSGSDWCIPCIKMKKEIFSNEDFRKFADSNLVLVNADFPRSKKNQPEDKVAHQNDDLAEKYNPKGHFPFTLLLDAEGNVLKTWDGLPDGTPADFTAAIRNASDVDK